MAASGLESSSVHFRHQLRLALGKRPAELFQIEVAATRLGKHLAFRTGNGAARRGAEPLLLTPSPSASRWINVGLLAGNRKRRGMTRIVYEVVEHDGGWTYKLGDVFTETYATHEEASLAARAAAAEHQLAGTTEPIEFEDAEGVWHEETADGDDRPEAVVSDPEG